MRDTHRPTTTPRPPAPAADVQIETEATVIGTYVQPDQNAQRTALERLTTAGEAKSE